MSDLKRRIAVCMTFVTFTCTTMVGCATNSDTSAVSPPSAQVIDNTPLQPHLPVGVTRDRSVGECSMPPVFERPNTNPVITFVVPEGWSVWKCIDERFGPDMDSFIVRALEYFRFWLDLQPDLRGLDIHTVPPGFTFVMGSDGAGPQK